VRRASLSVLALCLACPGEPPTRAGPPAASHERDRADPGPAPAPQPTLADGPPLAEEAPAPARTAAGEPGVDPAAGAPPDPALDRTQAPPLAGQEVGPQPDEPGATVPSTAPADLRPEHIQKAVWDAMSEAERRAARAHAARKAYER
jgi:hypothetical protein